MALQIDLVEGDFGIDREFDVRWQKVLEAVKAHQLWEDEFALCLNA